VWGSRSIIILRDVEQNEFYEKNDINIWIYFIDRNRSWYIFFYKGIEMNKLIYYIQKWFFPDMLFKNEAMYEQFKHKMKKK